VETNVLYYGDNLDILRRYVPDGSVDLVYLDPPFNSNRDYNVIFRDESGRKSDAQIVAFDDTWHWGPGPEAHYAYLTNTALNQGRVPSPVSTIVAALRAGIGENQMMAYLVEMAVRLVELHRVLKPTGSLYLHCDPTASHYLKVVLDAIFDARNFRNETVWRRFTSHNDARQGLARYGRVHDLLLFYGKSADVTWNQQYVPVGDEHLVGGYKRVELGTGRRYMEADLTANKPGGDTDYEWKGVRPYKGRHWAYSKANLEKFDAEGRLIYRRTGMPRLKLFLDELKGVGLQDVWTDIPPVSASSERLGYPTQKPVALLERIIAASSNPGDIVLDPFCGCGTALVAAQKLDRKWVGIDVTYLSIAVMKARLKDSFGLTDVEVIGQPTEVEGARAMLVGTGLEGQYQFQWWALDLVGAQPQGGTQKKGADKGVDGIINFTGVGGKMESVIVSVKSGHVGAAMVQQMKGAMATHGAAMGLFITLDEPTGPMKQESVISGVYHSEVSGKDYPRVQIFTIRELLDGRRPSLPLLVLSTYQQAERVEKKAAEQQELFG
jgi:DNA modification methylase